MSDFIPWTGGARPHPPRTRVTVRLRNGETLTGCSAFVRWWWDEAEPERDVVAWHEVPPSAAEQAAARLLAGPEPLLDRAARLIGDCGQRGDIGMLARDDYPDTGIIIVPTALLSDLVQIAVEVLEDGR